MDRWINRVAIVTGASSGIGAAIVKALVKKNVKVVGLARRLNNMENIKNELKNEEGEFFPIQCDISKEEDILKAFSWTEKQLGGVDILINNAGTCTMDLIIESSTENYRKVIDVNLIGPAICTREAVKIMRARDTLGHIIYINSVLGQNVEFFHTTSFNLYPPSKFALRAMTQIVELELQHVKSNIKITNVYPGLVKTEMPPQECFKDHPQDPFNYPYVLAEDISDGVIYALSTPPHVQVKELTITPGPTRLQVTQSK